MVALFVSGLNSQTCWKKMCGNLRGIQDICARTHRVKLTVLQCPYCSIERWNSFRGDNHSESYKADYQF